MLFLTVNVSVNLIIGSIVFQLCRPFVETWGMFLIVICAVHSSQESNYNYLLIYSAAQQNYSALYYTCLPLLYVRTR